MDLSRLWISRDMGVRRFVGSTMIEVNGVQGFLMEGDLAYLLEKSRRVPVGGTVVEIGSYMGLSTILLANGLAADNNLAARMYCVDTWQGSPEHQDLEVIRNNQLFQTFLGNLERAGVRSFVQPIRMPSVEASHLFETHSIDFLFVDGDHSYLGCKADLDAWFPKLKPGGVLFGHDCAPGSGVMQAVTEFAQQHGCRVLVDGPPTAHYMFECLFSPETA